MSDSTPGAASPTSAAYPNPTRQRASSRCSSAPASTMAVRSFDTSRSTPISTCSITSDRSSVFDIALGGVAQRLGVGALLALLGLHPHAVVDLTAQALDGPLEVARALLHALVEIGEGAVELLLGGASLGDVLERAEDPDHLAVEIAQRHLLRLDPTQVATRSPQPLDDADDRLAGGGDVGVPVHEPVGAELGIVGPRHVAVGLADQIVGLGAGERREHVVATQVARVAVLPEHGVGRRVHQRLQQLLAGLEGVVTAELTAQQRRVQLDVGAHRRLGGAHCARSRPPPARGALTSPSP